MKKQSVTIAGHSTSIALEPQFWDELKTIAARRDLPLKKLIEEIDDLRETSNLASALRLYVLHEVKNIDASGL